MLGWSQIQSEEAEAMSTLLNIAALQSHVHGACFQEAADSCSTTSTEAIKQSRCSVPFDGQHHLKVLAESHSNVFFTSFDDIRW